MTDFADRSPHFGSAWEKRTLVSGELMLRRHLTEHPEDAEARALLAYGLLLRKQHTEATKEALEAIRLDDQSALAHFALSCSLTVHPLKRRRDRARVIGEAIAAAHRAIELKPESQVFYAHLAHIHLDIAGRFPFRNSIDRQHALAGLQAVDYGLWLDPHCLSSAISRAKALLRLDRFEELESTISTAIALHPEVAFFQWFHQTCLCRRGEFNQALAAILKACQLEPDNRFFQQQAAVARHQARFVNGVTAIARRLGFLRFKPDNSLLIKTAETPEVNWTAGRRLSLAVMSCTALLLVFSERWFAYAFAICVGLVTFLGALIARQSNGQKPRPVFAFMLFFIFYSISLMIFLLSYVLFLQCIFHRSRSMMFRSPPGFWIRPLEAVGLVAVTGMTLFLLSASMKGVIAKNQLDADPVLERTGEDPDPDVADG